MSVAVTETMAGIDLLGDVGEGRQRDAPSAARPERRGAPPRRARRRAFWADAQLREVETAGEDHPEDDRAGEESGERQNLRFRTHTVHR